MVDLFNGKLSKKRFEHLFGTSIDKALGKELTLLKFAKAIKENVSISVIAVGLINTATQGDELLNNGYCDMVAYGRELLRNPNFAFMAAKELNNENFILKPYLGAFK